MSSKMSPSERLSSSHKSRSGQICSTALSKLWCCAGTSGGLHGDAGVRAAAEHSGPGVRQGAAVG